MRSRYSGICSASSWPELLASDAQVEGFSRRFLREAMIFPFRSADGSISSRSPIPLDTAAIRAAEIVFGDRVEIVIASFEDISTVLERLDGGEAAEADLDRRRSQR